MLLSSWFVCYSLYSSNEKKFNYPNLRYCGMQSDKNYKCVASSQCQERICNKLENAELIVLFPDDITLKSAPFSF